jgi:hypothetical protein
LRCVRDVAEGTRYVPLHPPDGSVALERAVLRKPTKLPGKPGYLPDLPPLRVGTGGSAILAVPALSDGMPPPEKPKLIDHWPQRQLPPGQLITHSALLARRAAT